MARLRTIRVPSPQFVSQLDEELFFPGRFIELVVDGAPDGELPGLFGRWQVEVTGRR